MLFKEIDGINWLEFELLTGLKEIKHGSFTRKGGFSQGNFHSLNLGLNSGDSLSLISKNLKKIENHLSIPPITYLNQVHGKTIHQAPWQNSRELKVGDGFISNKKNLPLLIQHADCQAALFYDPCNKAIANVHAGWRGMVENIYKEAIDRMNKIYGTQPENLLVCISPSLGPENAQFIHYKKEFPEWFWDYQTRENYFDLWEISRVQLTQLGILNSHIEIAKICTHSNPQDFFSYRRNPQCGRNGTFIMLS